MASPDPRVDGLVLAAIVLEDPALEIAGGALPDPLREKAKARMDALSRAAASERDASLRAMAAALRPVPREGTAIATRSREPAPGLEDLLRRLATRADEDEAAEHELRELGDALSIDEEPSWAG